MPTRSWPPSRWCSTAPCAPSRPGGRSCGWRRCRRSRKPRSPGRKTPASTRRSSIRMRLERPPFVVPVADLLRRPGTRRQEELHGHLPVSVVGTDVATHADVTVRATLESVSEGILATGVLSAPWQSECSRCLQPVSGTVDAEFQELFERHPREGDTYPLGHDQVDLEPLVREVLLLELPLTALCRVECLGICPTCVSDL